MTLAAQQSSFNPIMLVIFALLIVFLFFSFRKNKKTRQEHDQMQKQVVPGAEVMTTFGVFGTVVSMDETANTVVLETSPGVTLRVLRPAIGKVVAESDAPADSPADSAAAAESHPTIEPTDASDENPSGGKSEPEFGERRNDQEK